MTMKRSVHSFFAESLPARADRMTKFVQLQSLVVVAAESGLLFHTRPFRPGNLMLGGQAFTTFSEALAVLPESQTNPAVLADLERLRQTAEACDWNELKIASAILNA